MGTRSLILAFVSLFEVTMLTVLSVLKVESAGLKGKQALLFECEHYLFL